MATANKWLLLITLLYYFPVIQILFDGLVFYNLRPSGADCLHLGVKRGFSDAMAACPTFFGIPKDNLVRKIPQIAEYYNLTNKKHPDRLVTIWELNLCLVLPKGISSTSAMH